MRDFWRAKNAVWHVRMALRRAVRLIAEEIYGSLKGSVLFRRLGAGRLLKWFGNLAGVESTRELAARGSAPVAKAEHGPRPVIFVSACESENKPGGDKYCGGTKELECLVKLLRLHGYEAYVVTWNGEREPWLVEHQPCISLTEFRKRLKVAPEVRCVTSLASAAAFIRECPGIYFWDMELAATGHFHFAALAKMHKRKIRRVAAISRTVQAWHMTSFGTPCTVIPNLLDESIWSPSGERVKGRVGYMNEGTHTDEYVTRIRGMTESCGLELDFQLISGAEADVLAGMRSCEVFLGMNAGKDPLWGEGCPRTLIEASSTGCVVVAFDLIGNRETLIDNFNAVIVPRQSVDEMAEALVRLHTQPDEIERMRTNALSLIQSCHTLGARWPAVKEFLELDRRS
jgi:glycosyltransferase involved in cell wall biosynthesis